MGLILSTQFHKGTFIEKVSNTYFQNTTNLGFVKSDGVLGMYNKTATGFYCTLNDFTWSKKMTFSMGIDKRDGLSYCFGNLKNLNTAGSYNIVNYFVVGSQLVRSYVNDGTIGNFPNVSVSSKKGLSHIICSIDFDSNTGFKVYMDNVYYNNSLNDTNTNISLITNGIGFNSNKNAPFMFLNVFDHILSVDEIASEYQYFQNLKSPVKKVYSTYFPKLNKLIDGLISHFDFTEGNGKIVYDKIDESRYCTFIRCEKRQDGIGNISMSSQYALQAGIILNKSLLPNNNSWSISYFFDKFIPVTSTFGIYSIFGSQQNSCFLLNDGSNYVGIRIANNSSISYNGTNNTIACPTSLVVNKPILLVLTYDGTRLSLYINNKYFGYLTCTPAELGLNIIRLTNGFNIGNSGAVLTLREVKTYDKILSTEEIDVDYNGKLRITLNEDFSNYAVGQTYGEPYLTNPRPVVAELQTPMFGYPAGKKYISHASGTATHGYIKSNQAYGKWEFKVNIINGYSGNFYLSFISNLRNNGSAWVVNGYQLALASNRELQLTRNGSSLATIQNAFNFNELTTIEITRDINNVFEVKVNDISIIKVSDATYSTSQNIRIETKFCEFYEIKHTSI